MDQLHLMTVFVAVAELQGFAAASRKLQMSPPAVTRAITALEENIGVKLLARTTRHVKTTEAGQRYLQDAKRILQEVVQANEAAQGIHGEAKGLLRVTAPVLFGQQFVLPCVLTYLKQFPLAQVESVFIDRVVNLLEEGFDVGIRIGHLSDSSMHARYVGDVSLILVAAPEYLKQHGMPLSPQDLNDHAIVATSTGDLAHDWHFEQAGKATSLRVHARLSVNTNQAAINAAKQGMGISRVLSYQVRDELKHGALKTVLTDFMLPPLPVHIVYRGGPNASAKVRSFIDLLVSELAPLMK